jgi:hypothetical protein
MGDRPCYLQPNSACFRVILGEALCEQTDQIAISFEA